MKRFLALIVIAALVLSLTGCVPDFLLKRKSSLADIESELKDAASGLREASSEIRDALEEAETALKEAQSELEDAKGATPSGLADAREDAQDVVGSSG